MDTPENATVSNEEPKQKRSPWLIIIIILLILMMGCCLIGAFLCRGSARLPDLLDGFITDIPGMESEEDFWGLVDELTREFDGDTPLLTHLINELLQQNLDHL